MNNSEEILPSYEDVIREEQRIQKSKLCTCLSNKGLLFTNVFLSATGIWGFYMVWYTNKLTVRKTNVTKYCNDVRYNFNPIPTSSYFTAGVSTTLCFALCYLLEWISSKIEKYNHKQLIKNIILKTWILGTYLTFLVTCIGILKCAAGIPYPYFFSNKNITNLYCENKFEKGYMPFSLTVADNQLRKSFPSCRSGIYTFSVTFMYLYVDHFDIQLGFHATQQLIIMIMGSCLTYFQFSSWKEGENHLCDILVGAGLGFIHAIITVRNMFGSIFHSPIRISVRKIQTVPNFLPTAPPLEFDDPAFSYVFTTRRYESNETLVMSRENDRNLEEAAHGSNNVVQMQNDEEPETVLQESEC